MQVEKPVMKKVKTSIAVDQDHYNLLSRIAKSEGMSKSAMVSVCISSWVSQHDTWIKDHGYKDSGENS
jgi:hypothetical protein